MATKSFLQFVERMRQIGKKTLVWDVLSGSGETLGQLSWWSHWRKYVFCPSHNAVFDEACLREIADFVEAKTAKYKQGQL